MSWYVGMYGAMALAGVLLYYKPDTRYVLAVYLTTLMLKLFNGLIAYKPGLCRKPRRAWRLEERRRIILDQCDIHVPSFHALFTLELQAVSVRSRNSCSFKSRHILMRRKGMFMC